MSLSEDLNDYYEKVCELRKRRTNQRPQNGLSQEIVNVNEAYVNAAFDINNLCRYLNDSTNETLKGRAAAHAILVGKESAPLIVSLKQLSDTVYYKDDIKDSEINTQKIIQNTLSISEDNLHRLEDLCKATKGHIQNMEYLFKTLKNQDKLDSNSSTVSEVSSFLDKDVVTSSPISQREKYDP